MPQYLTYPVQVFHSNSRTVQFSYQDNADLHDRQLLPVHGQGHPPVGGGDDHAGQPCVQGCVQVAVTSQDRVRSGLHDSTYCMNLSVFIA